jgi:hypothetical protein
MLHGFHGTLHSEGHAAGYQEGLSQARLDATWMRSMGQSAMRKSVVMGGLIPLGTSKHAQ